MKRVRGDTHRRRSRRVILLLVLLALLNGFDLVCTMSVHQFRAFEEANPVARYMLKHPAMVVVFKISMVTFASIVLFTFRRRKTVELACWGVCAVYIALAFIWVRHLAQTEMLTGFLRSAG